MLKYPPQSNLKSQIPAVQEALKPNYPLAEPKPINNFAISINQQTQEKQLIPETQMEYHFLTPDRTSGALVKEDRLIYHTLDYPKEGFPKYLEDISKLVKTIKSSLNISHFISMGMRSIDVISKEESEEYSDYLEERFIPQEFDNLPVQCIAGEQSYLYTTELGQLILKCYFLEDAGHGIPPDLMPLASTLNVEQRSYSDEIVLDIDHILIPPDRNAIELDIGNMGYTCQTLHDLSSNIFESIVKPDAFKKWKG